MIVYKGLLAAFNRSSSLSYGVLCELYLQFDIDLTACFCGLLIRFRHVMLIYHRLGVT